MFKVVYDVIQRFEVENGVPRLVSTNISVIEGGEDLMSLATRLLQQLGFEEKFKLSRASQYIGYRLKNPGKGAKRYQLVLTQRKEELCISIPRDVLHEHVLQLGYWIPFPEGIGHRFDPVGIIWVLPSKKDIFLDLIAPQYWDILQVEGKTVGEIELNKYATVMPGLFYCVIPNSEIIPRNEVRIEALSDNSSYLILTEDKLFPYTWQVCISSREVLEEFLSYFAKILIENQ